MVQSFSCHSFLDFLIAFFHVFYEILLIFVLFFIHLRFELLSIDSRMHDHDIFQDSFVGLRNIICWHHACQYSFRMR